MQKMKKYLMLFNKTKILSSSLKRLRNPICHSLKSESFKIMSTIPVTKYFSNLNKENFRIFCWSSVFPAQVSRVRFPGLSCGPALITFKVQFFFNFSSFFFENLFFFKFFFPEEFSTQYCIY